jgi:hypothetical protein
MLYYSHTTDSPVREQGSEEQTMAVNGPYYVDAVRQFAHGLAVVGEVSKVLVYDESRKPEDRLQERDRDTGLLLWSVTVLDFDPGARETTFEVRVPSDREPVLPPLAPGMPLRFVQLEGVQINCYPKVTGRNRKTGQDIVRMAYQVTATGWSAAKPVVGADGSKAA